MKVRIRRSGSIFIGVTLFMGVAAANTGNNLIYVIVSAMLSVMLSSGVASILNIRRLEVTVLPPPEVYAGKATRLKVVIKRKFRFPSFLLRVSCGEGEVFTPLIGSKPVELEIPITFQRRGHVNSIRVRITSDFPLGTFERTVWMDVPLGVVVFPEEIPCDLRTSGLEREETGEMRIDISERGYEDIKDIREYSGEPIKLIHWKLTAKKDQLLVKDMASLEDRPVVINLHELEGDIESKISKATYLVNNLMKGGFPVGVNFGDREIPPARGERQRFTLLRELALY